VIAYRVSTPTLTAVAYVTKGLVDVTEAEILRILGSTTFTDRSDRYMMFRSITVGITALLAQARTIDDLRALVVGRTTVSTEKDLLTLCATAAEATTAILGMDRAADDRWSLTLSAKRPIWTHAKWSPRRALSRYFRGASTHDAVRQPVDLRLQADAKTMHVSVNLVAAPVGKRAVAERAGALRPTVAAALVQLATNGIGDDVAASGVYDPFCGSGTVLLEAHHAGRPVFGSDADPTAVELTRERLAPSLDLTGDSAVAALNHRFFAHDVLNGVPKRVTAATLVTNLPWGKQVIIPRRGDLYSATAALAATCSARGGRAVLLTTHEDQCAAAIRRTGRTGKVTTRRIGLLGQTPAIVLVEPQ
jgi:Putative RNA methylase family UPF0020